MMMMMIFEYSRSWLRLSVTTSVSATEMFQKNKERNAQRTTTDTSMTEMFQRNKKRRDYEQQLTSKNEGIVWEKYKQTKRYRHHSYEYMQKQWQQIILTGSFQKNAIAVTLCVVRLLAERNVLAWTK